MRKLRMMLAVGGGLMLLIGLGMLVWGLTHELVKLRWLGGLYMVLAVAVLAGRQAMIAVAAAREERADEDVALADGADAAREIGR